MRHRSWCTSHTSWFKYDNEMWYNFCIFFPLFFQQVLFFFFLRDFSRSVQQILQFVMSLRYFCFFFPLFCFDFIPFILCLANISPGIVKLFYSFWTIYVSRVNKTVIWTNRYCLWVKSNFVVFDKNVPDVVSAMVAVTGSVHALDFVQLPAWCGKN